MSKKEIKIGFTNKKYHDGNKFILIKNKDGFNHKINYGLLAEFDFVPNLIEETKEKLVWEYIDGEMIKKPNNEDLKKLAKIIRTLHKSELVFPKNNMRKRMQKYLNIIHDKTKNSPEIEDNYRDAVKLLSKMGKLNPCHNDLWGENIIKDKNGKIWIVDWEYATMGDKHFDIAYFMEAYYLDENQCKIFLNAYNSYDNYWAYIPEWLSKYKKFVNYITLCWALSQDQTPFSLDKIKNRLRDKENY